MEKVNKIPSYLDKVIILILISLLLLQRECSRCPDPPEPTHSRTVVWIYDTTHYITQLAIPYPVEKLVPVEIPAIVDTNAILQEYFSRNVYQRVLKDDTLAYILLQDTVTRNSLGRSSLVYENRRPTQIITNTTTILPSVGKVFAGPMIGSGFDGKLALGGSAFYVSKRDHAYGLSVDPFARSVQASMYWKISFRKKIK